MYYVFYCYSPEDDEPYGYMATVSKETALFEVEHYQREFGRGSAYYLTEENVTNHMLECLEEY